MTPPAIHVTPYGTDVWAVRAAGDGRPLSRHGTRDAAVTAGRAMAKTLKADLVIFDELWRVETREKFDDLQAADGR